MVLGWLLRQGDSHEKVVSFIVKVIYFAIWKWWWLLLFIVISLLKWNFTNELEFLKLIPNILLPLKGNS